MAKRNKSNRVRINSTPGGGRARSSSRSRGSLVKTNRALETHQSGGMFRPTQNFAQGLNGGVVCEKFVGRKKRAKRGAGAGRGLPGIVTAYIDPFDEDSVGVRYPDNFRGLSGPFVGSSIFSISTAGAINAYTDTNMYNVTPTAGTSLMFFTPDPRITYVQGVCGSNAGGIVAGIPNQWQWPNGILYTGAPGSGNSFGPSSGILNVDYTIGNLPSYSNLFSSARMVAGGVKITSTQNFTSVSGTIHMAPCPYNFSMMTTTGDAAQASSGVNVPQQEMLNSWQCQLPTNLNAMSDLPGYVQYPLSSLEQDEMVAIFKRFGEEALLYKATGTAWGLTDDNTGTLQTRFGAAGVETTIGHYGILLYVDGVQSTTGGVVAPGTPILECEWRSHYECQPAGNSAVIGTTGGSVVSSIAGATICTPSPPYQPLLLAAADNLSSEIPTVRCVDDAGVEEVGFVTEVARLWKNASAIATSVSAAIPAVTGIISALAI